VKIAMTLAPGSGEYVAAQLAFHLNAGVDLVIAALESPDQDVSSVLDDYARQGQVVRAPELGHVSTPEGRALAIRLAAREHSADWLISADSGEFWWPRGASLKDVLVSVPPRYGVVQALVREFQPRPGADPFAERMTIRDSLAQSVPGEEPLLHLLRPIQRLRPGVGEHPGQPLRAWYPVEVLRFPRDARAGLASRDGGEEAISQALDAGSLVVDERLRNALRELRDGDGYRLPSDAGSMLAFPVPTVVDDALYAVECAAIGEVDLVRLDEHIRELESRISQLEQTLWSRVLRRLGRLGRRRR
jgi:hypothetical protein